MSTEFEREERYIVFKLSDLGNSLKGDEIRRLAREYAEQRRLRGKPPLECAVVESDWPEYEPTWRAIEARVAGERLAPSMPSPDSKYFVSHWYIPNGSDYDQARVVKLFFSEDCKEEVEKIVARYDYPPEMPVICKL